MKHAIVISVSLVLAVLFLYSGLLPWPESAHLYRDFSRGPAQYEISLFLLTGIVVYASVFLKTTIGIVTAVLVTLAVMPNQVFGLHEIPFFRPISFGAAAILIAALVGTLVNRRNQTKEAYQIQQSLARQVVTTQEREKQSLAHELHDTVLQKAVDIAHEIDDLSEEVSEEVSKAGLRRLRTDIENMMEQTRQLVRGLRPLMLDEVGFVLALKELADSMAEHGIEGIVNVRGEEDRLPELVETVLFRIAEEALNNARRHARATRIDIALEFAPDKVSLRLTDNGVGFVLPTQRQLVSENKFGIVDMTERAWLAGGSLQVESAPGRGTVIIAEVPLSRRA